VAQQVSPPRAFDPYTDADSGTPSHGANLFPVVLDKKAIAEQIKAVLVQGNAHRHGQVSWSATKLVS
jgi:hypothetical protein